MKAVVIGAAGHVGNAIVRALLDRNWEVTACGRRKTPPANLAGLPVRYLAGDTRAPGQFDNWIAGHDLVVDAAAPYPLDIFSIANLGGPEPLADADMRTRRLLDSVVAHDATLAYIGSFVTLARPHTTGQQLQSELVRLAHPYFEVKELIESQIVRAAKHGLRAVLVNPTYCLGPWDLHDRRLCTIPLLLSGAVPSSISQMLDVIDVRDVASAVIAALEAERFGVPILVSGHTISTDELYLTICRIGGAPPPRITSSASLALIGSYCVEVALGLIGRKTPLLSGGMMMATAFDYLETNSELKQLGVTLTPLDATITDSIEWYRDIGYC
jgi:dihydroflavonol-4-reductase